MSGAVATLQVCIPLELLCYIVIYWTLRQKNKSLVNIVQDDVLEYRAKKNAITLTGQALAFVIELTYSILAQVLIHFGPAIGVFEPGATPCALIVAMAAVTSGQILASPELRRLIQGYN